MTKFPNIHWLIGVLTIWKLENWNLFGICDLEFEMTRTP
jgi:hypothetical protein